MCVFLFFHFMYEKNHNDIIILKKKKTKPNKIIKFAACTEHDREYTFHYFEFFSIKFYLNFALLSALNYSLFHLHEHSSSFVHTLSQTWVYADVKLLC